jgi:hypothetical protein
VGAAGTQQLKHLRLVGAGVELRAHVVRPGGHLAHGEDDRQDLDEDRFH